MDEDHKLFYVDSGVWTLVPDLGIEVYQNTGHMCRFRIAPDGVYTTERPQIWKLRHPSNG